MPLWCSSTSISCWFAFTFFSVLGASYTKMTLWLGLRLSMPTNKSGRRTSLVYSCQLYRTGSSSSWLSLVCYRWSLPSSTSIASTYLWRSPCTSRPSIPSCRCKTWLSFWSHTWSSMQGQLPKLTIKCHRCRRLSRNSYLWYSFTQVSQWSSWLILAFLLPNQRARWVYFLTSYSVSSFWSTFRSLPSFWSMALLDSSKSSLSDVMKSCPFSTRTSSQASVVPISTFRARTRWAPWNAPKRKSLKSGRQMSVSTLMSRSITMAAWTRDAVSLWSRSLRESSTSLLSSASWPCSSSQWLSWMLTICTRR